MTVSLIVLDTDSRHWLATDTGALPSFDDQNPRPTDFAKRAKETWGLSAHVLFCPFRTREERIVVLERTGDLPQSLHWTDDLEPLSHSQRGALETARHPHPQRVPWAVPGWRGGVEHWLSEVLELPPVALELVRTWSLSCVLRTQTPQGAVYFKATNLAPLFCNEPLVTQRLAQRFPGKVPKPLAIDASRGWMALADFGTALNEQPEQGGSADALRTLGTLQREFLGCDDELLALGVVDRRLPHLEAELRTLFSDPLCAFSEPERETLLACPWHHWLSALAEFPSSLVHGDPHTGNVVQTAEGYALFDWSDASVAPPWMDLLDALFEDDQAIRQKLIDAHAEALGIRLPWATIAPVLGVYHAVSYRSILNAIEPSVRHEHGDVVAAILRKAVDFTGNS